MPPNELRTLIAETFIAKTDLTDRYYAIADEWEADIDKRQRDYTVALEMIVALRQRLEAADRRLVETILAWRAGEKPEDYPELAALAGKP